MPDISIKEFQYHCLNYNLPFVSFRSPNGNSNTYLSNQKNIFRFQSYEEIEKNHGFIFTPFSNIDNYPKILIKPLVTFKGDIFNTSLSKNANSIKSIENKEKFITTKKVIYEKNVQKIIQEINDEKLKKVVLSRIEIIKSIENKKLPDLYCQIEKEYPGAFVFFVHIPNIITWIGASPELFLRNKNNRVQTSAFAGTQKGNDITNIKWYEKEIQEQRLVSDFIENVLKNNNINNYEMNGPFTEKAGEVCHLKTLFSFTPDNIKDINKLINELHPTPAISGFPKIESMQLINKLESHNRKYYGGILGQWESSKKMQLYINLRCMQIVDNKLVLYTGAGITSQSEPEKEWQETNDKINKLKNIIHKTVH